MTTSSSSLVKAGRGGRGGGLPDPPLFRGCRPIGLDALAFKPSARTFALRVEDEAMRGRHILPGDIVVLENGRTPRPGEVVAALVDNESVLREFCLEGGQPCLRAAHPALGRSIPARELVIQGVMVRLFRG